MTQNPILDGMVDAPPAGCAATPRDVLLAQLLSPHVPKTEREHMAARRIVEMEAELERLQHDIERHVAIAAEQATEIARLRAGGCARDQRLTQYCAEARAALARAEAAERDAARYRWLRDCCSEDAVIQMQDWNEDGATETYYGLRGAALDAAIDAAKERTP